MHYRIALCLAIAFTACGDQDTVAPESLAPAAPTGVLTSARTGEIILSWKDVANETSYKVELRGDGGQWLPLAETSANATSYTHAGVTHNVSYVYRVAACNANGCSSWVEAGGKWDTAAPPELSSVGASAIGSTNATLFARGYTGGLATRVIFTLRKSGENTPVFVSEPIEASESGEVGEFGKAFVATVTHSALQAGTEYTVSASASNTVGSAPPVAAATFKTNGPAPALLGQLATSVGAAEVTLSLRVHPNNLATQLRFEVSAQGSTFTPIRTENATIPAGTNWASVSTGLPLAAGSYRWRAVAVNDMGTTTSNVLDFVVP